MHKLLTKQWQNNKNLEGDGMINDSDLRRYCTTLRQREIIQAIIGHGNPNAAAKADGSEPALAAYEQDRRK